MTNRCCTTCSAVIPVDSKTGYCWGCLPIAYAALKDELRAAHEAMFWLHNSLCPTLEYLPDIPQGVTQIRNVVAGLKDEIAVMRHGELLAEERSRRGITDCSTPIYVRIQNIVEELERVEAERDAALAARDQRWESLRAGVESLRPAICGDQFAAGQGTTARCVLDKMRSLESPVARKEGA